jgi:MoaA/NifB/PqqE/SkfB family radical SAM enzyme
VEESIRYHRVNTGNEIVLLPLVPDIRKLYVEVTAECDFSCITCIRHSWSDEVGRMSGETFERLLYDCKQLPDLQTTHFGGFGEPLTHPNIEAMLACLLQTGRLYGGDDQQRVILTDAVIAALLTAGLDYLFVSLDGSDPQSYETISPRTAR